jgi:hypothetical protein
MSEVKAGGSYWVLVMSLYRIVCGGAGCGFACDDDGGDWLIGETLLLPTRRFEAPSSWRRAGLPERRGSGVGYEAGMTSSTKSLYAGRRFPPELISYTVWLYFRFPLSLRMVKEMLAFRGIEVSHETIRQ